MIKKLDQWCDNVWIYFMCAVAAVVAVFLIVNWNTWPLGAKAGAFGVIIMPLHVIEEWKLPGGLHYFYNVMLGPKESDSQHLDRYPMSRFTDMITNIGMQFFPLLYLVLSLVTNLSTELAIGIMLFSFTEVFAHTFAGIVCMRWYRKAGKRTIYNPGFGTSYLLFLPAGIYLAVHMPTWTVGNWIGGIIALLVILICCVPLAERPFKNWVVKQGGDTFAFKSPRYFKQFTEKH